MLLRTGLLINSLIIITMTTNIIIHLIGIPWNKNQLRQVCVLKSNNQLFIDFPILVYTIIKMQGPSVLLVNYERPLFKG